MFLYSQAVCGGLAVLHSGEDMACNACKVPWVETWLCFWLQLPVGGCSGRPAGDSSGTWLPATCGVSPPQSVFGICLVEPQQLICI